MLTNRRVIQVEGIVNKRATDSSLEKINDAVLTQSIFGRMFGFGDLDILTAAEAGIERFRMLIDPIGFKRAMLDAKHEYEVDMERSGWQPSPPIRAAAPVAPRPARRPPAARPTAAGGAGRSPAPASPVAPRRAAATASTPVTVDGHAGRPWPRTRTGSSAAAHPMRARDSQVDPDEVTRTLANLADLRDRGAITAEEYEAKKADLLGAALARADAGRSQTVGVAAATIRGTPTLPGAAWIRSILPATIVVAIMLLVGFPVHEFATPSPPIGSATARPSCSGG